MFQIRETQMKDLIAALLGYLVEFPRTLTWAVFSVGLVVDISPWF